MGYNRAHPQAKLWARAAKQEQEATTAARSSGAEMQMVAQVAMGFSAGQAEDAAWEAADR